MNFKIKYIIIFFLLFSFIEKSHAQYFVSDVDPVYLKWKKIVDKKHGNIIFPDYILNKALSISFFRDTLTSLIDYNIPIKLRRFQITLHPTNMLSNGMVTYTPQRMELYTMPSRDNFSLPWLKQLVAHEYRHVAQLSNLNQGMTRGISYILGEQMLGLTAILMPTYLYEGDAVVAETQFSMFGRGKQPSFNTPLIADVLENTKFHPRRYKLGTMNHFTPDPYLMGYHLTQHSTAKYGDDFWSKVFRFAARNPYLIDPCFFSYRKYGNKTNSMVMIRDMVKDLSNFWQEQLLIENSSTIIPTKISSYTTYAYPIQLNDTILIAHKSDLDRAGRFVMVNSHTGEEKVLFNTGYISSRPLFADNRMYWSEIVSSLSWGQKNSSSVFYAEITNNSISSPKRIHKLKGNYFFFTPFAKKGFIAVEYDETNSPEIVQLDNNYNIITKHPITGNDISFNGLCYDPTTDSVYGAIVDDRGTSMIQYNYVTGEIKNLTPPNYGTITNLTAKDGKLYYTSITSGKEEVHIYDLIQKQEYQLTTSRYGSQASTATGNNVIMTTYTPKGYLLAIQGEGAMKECQWQKMPSEKMLYPYKEWDVEKLDTVNFTKITATGYNSTKRVKKYNKTLNSVHIHSWLPFYVDVNKIIEDRELTIGWGANILSQNLLNSVIASVGYGRVNDGNLWTAAIKYVGLPVHLTMDLESGGGKQETYNFQMIEGKRKEYFRIGGSATLPFNFSSGGNNRFLEITMKYDYFNSLIYNRIYSNSQSTIGGTEITDITNYPKTKINEGLDRITSRITYQSTLKTTRKALNPRWGYIVQVNNTFNPADKDFGNILSFYGRAYLPGPFLHGSFTVEAGTQYQTNTQLHFNQTLLRPRGVDYYGEVRKSYAATLDYRVPLCYPNSGLGSLLNFQRISVAGFFEYANYQTFYSKKWNSANSYGGTIIFDVNLLGIRNLFNINISLFKPSDKSKVITEMGFSIAL